MLLRKCDDPHAQGMMVITFLFRGEFAPQEKEDFAKSTEKSSATTLANTYLKVFTKHRTFILTASSDEELTAWCDLIFPVLKDLMGEGAFTTAEQYAKALDPILRKKYYAKMLKGQEILQTLDKHGFFDDNLKRGRDKQGKLYIKHHVDDTWTKYTVILKGPYLYYYSRGNKYNRRMVVLRYSTCTTRDDVEGGGAVFEVDTPIMTYLMKAKHNVAREEWIKAIEKNRFVKKKKKRLAALSPRGNALPNFYEEGTAETLLKTTDENTTDKRKKKRHGKGPINMAVDKPYLSYVPPNRSPAKKPKEFKIKKNSTVIGRSSSAGLRIEDAKLAAEHARLDVVDFHLVLIDLGSTRGTKLNHHRVRERMVLYPGDKIKVGQTRMELLVEDAPAKDN